ncbi:MAG: hypothetical protein R3320_12685 [Nitriliruptorales bacterium]|nr:hypothetical protein [Nitriliruptorales bacterium]
MTDDTGRSATDTVTVEVAGTTAPSDTGGGPAPDTDLDQDAEHPATGGGVLAGIGVLALWSSGLLRSTRSR